MSGDAPGLASVVEAERERGVLSLMDPRSARLGALTLRVKGREEPTFPEGFDTVDRRTYDLLNIVHGIPHYGKELIFDKTIPLEANVEWINGVSFNKGCYLGQELTARSHFQGIIRKRLLPVIIRPLGEDPKPRSLVSLASLTQPVGDGFLPQFIDEFNDDNVKDDALDELRAGEISEVPVRVNAKGGGKLYTPIVGNVGLAQLRMDNIKEPSIHSVAVGGRDYELVPFAPEWWPRDHETIPSPST